MAVSRAELEKNTMARIERYPLLLIFALRSLARAWRSRPQLVTRLADAAPQAWPAARVRIGPGDLLHLAVFDVPELAQEVRVSDTGDATLTLLGSLHLEGLTTEEAKS